MAALKEKTDYGTPVRGRSHVRGQNDETYHIVEVMENTEDEMYATDRARSIMKFLPISAAAAIVSSFMYWRLYVGQLLVFRSRGQNMNLRLMFAMIDLLIAFSVAVKGLLDSMAILTPQKKRPVLRLTGSVVPQVDIIITTCNEDIDICQDTVRAAMNLDYPSSKFRIVVADDGSCPEFREAIQAMSKSAQPQRLFYTSRIKGEDDRHKAANLNHALRFLSRLPGGAAPYVAGFDADMIPERHHLRASLPHLLQDAELGYTCPAATYYNNAINDPLLQSQTVVNKIEECFRDRVNSAWNTGSGWVSRRDALDKIGGFPMKDIAEDVHCSSALLNLGYKGAFLSESLQFGLVPDSYKGHLKQHRQWKLGGLQIGFAMKMGIFGKHVQGMKWSQRAYWVFYPLQALTSPLITLGLFTSPLFMLADIPWIIYDTPSDLKLLTRAASISFLCAFLYKCHIAVLTGFKAPLMESCNDIWMAPYHTITQLRTYVLPKWLGGRLFTFIPTGTIPNELNERSKARRAPLYHRLRSILIKEGALFHCFYTATCLVAVGMICSRAATRFAGDSTEFKVYLLTHLGWLPMPWFFATFACLTPLRYAIFPPDVPEREDLLERNPETNVAYPIKEARRVHWKFEWIGFQNLYIVVAFYCIGLLYSTADW